MSSRGPVWGADAPVSLPQPLETADTEMADFDGFCFTPLGMRVNLTAVDREALIGDGYGPTAGGRTLSDD